MKPQRLPTQELQHVFFPMIKIHKAIHVVRKEIIERSHGEKENKQTKHMADDLPERFKIHQPMRPEKNQNDKEAKRFKKKHRIP